VTAQPLPTIDLAPLLAGATGILIAVSGGPDSMALLHMLAVWPKHPPMAVATVNHGLRAGAAAEAHLVAGQAARLGLTSKTLVWTGDKPATGIQEAARAARYALLISEAKRLGLSHLVTAHHADDQAETVLMRLVSGSGIGGLGGMRQEMIRDGVVHVRPLLDVPKDALLAYCHHHDILYVTDPSNENTQFGRVRLRKSMATLAQEGLTRERLVTLARRARQAEEALNAMADAALASADFSQTDCIVQANWNSLATEPRDIRIRALARLLLLSRGATDGLKLAGLERLSQEIDLAYAVRNRLRRSIAERIVTLSTKGQLSFTAAPARRRGKK
jgi:tRNA(Ile)-lysidine synthase